VEQLVALCARRDRTDSDRYDGKHGWEARLDWRGKVKTRTP
jgi:hypothetical protein